MKIIVVLDVPESEIPRLTQILGTARERSNYYITRPLSINEILVSERKVTSPENRLKKFNELVRGHRLERFKALILTDFPQTHEETEWLKKEHPEMFMGVTSGPSGGTCPVLKAFRTQPEIPIIEISTGEKGSTDEAWFFLEKIMPVSVPVV